MGMKDLQLQRIPSLPSTIVEILQGEKRGSYFSPRDLAEIVVTDPGLTAETLRIANSSYYGVSGKVKTVSQAINILGVNTVRRLAVTSSPTVPLPRVAPTLNNPSRYVSEMARPSILGSTT